MSDTLTVKLDRVTLSELLARHYRRVVPGIVETVWAMNQDIAKNGPFLPVGTVLAVPSDDEIDATSSPEVIGLFD